MKIRKRLLGIWGVLLLGIIAGCNENSPGELENELKNTGKVIFKITDAPFPSEMVSEANITIDQVQLFQRWEDDTQEETDDFVEGDQPENYVIDLAEDTTFNLLELSNGITAFLGEVVVPAGEYHQIRMHVLDAEIVLNDGSVFDLKVPSGSASGLKIKIHPSLVVNEGEETEILLDVDVNRSFIMRGNLNHPKGKNNIQGFIFKPVIRAVPQKAAGQISGVVADTSGVAIENAVVALLADSDTVTTALTTEEGYYAIPGIPDGFYFVSCSKDEFESQVSEELQIAAGDILEKDFILVPEEQTAEE